MKKIGVDEIHRYAFVPQCCDNQFVPNDMLSTFDPDSKKDRKGRYVAARAELIRSMIYSSQVLVNRVAFFNNDVFLDIYGKRKEKGALIELFNDGRMIPIMYKEKEFSKNEIKENNTFTMNNRIEQFFKFLDHDVKDSNLNYCVITENDKVKARIQTFLTPFFSAFSDMTKEEVAVLVKEISPDRVEDSNYITAFRSHLWRISSEYTQLSRALKEEKKSFDREQMYKQWIVIEGSKPANMYIDRNKEFVVETKKLIDLAYNYNLSAAYNRYFFYPEGLPSPLIIPASLRSAGRELNNSYEYKEAVQREELIYKSQRTYRVPDAKKLTLEQVVRIQNTNEWQDFIKFQREMFDEPSKWGADTMWEYARVLTDMYIKIETDCDVRLLQSLYLTIRIVIKFSSVLTIYVDMGDAAQVISALDQILEEMDRQRDKAISAFIKIKHELRNEHGHVIEVFANGLSEIKLTHDDIIEIRKNYACADFSAKSDKEEIAQK